MRKAEEVRETANTVEGVDVNFQGKKAAAGGAETELRRFLEEKSKTEG